MNDLLQTLCDAMSDLSDVRNYLSTFNVCEKVIRNNVRCRLISSGFTRALIKDEEGNQAVFLLRKFADVVKDQVSRTDRSGIFISLSEIRRSLGQEGGVVAVRFHPMAARPEQDEYHAVEHSLNVNADSKLLWNLWNGSSSPTVLSHVQIYSLNSDTTLKGSTFKFYPVDIIS